MLARGFITGVVQLIFLGSAVFGASAVSVTLPIDRPLVVVYAPSGGQIAVGGIAPERDGPADGIVALVDVTTGKLQWALNHPGAVPGDSNELRTVNPIHAVAYSPDGKTLAVAAKMGLKLWDPADGKELTILAGYGSNEKRPQREITAISFSPDGTLLAAVERSFSDPCLLRVWEVAQREVVGDFELGIYAAHLDFLPDGTLLVTADKDDPATSWRLSNGGELSATRVKPGRFVVDRQGELVAAGGRGETMWRIEPTDSGGYRLADQVRLDGQGPMYGISSVAFSPDGTLLATHGRGGAIVLYDVQTHQPVGTLLNGGPFAFSPQGTSIAVARRSSERSPNGRKPSGTHVDMWNVADVRDADRLVEQARAAATELVKPLSAPQDKWMMYAGAATMDMLRTVYPPRPDLWMGQDRFVTVLAGPHGEAATPMLVAALNDPRLGGKQRLLQPLGLIARHDAKARAAIIAALRTAETADVRSMAAAMLAMPSTGEEQEAVAALVEAAVGDECPQVRAAAERTLSELSPQALQQVAEQAQARGPIDDRVQRRDGTLIYQGRSLEEWLGRLSASYMPNEIFGQPKPDEPLAAIRAMGPDAAPVILEALKGGQQPVRRAAVAALGVLQLPAESAIDPLLDVIARADPADLSFVRGVPGGVASEAADAVALICKDQQKPPAGLVELTHSDNPAARLSAARAIAQIQADHPRGVPMLRTALTASGVRPPVMVPYAWYFGNRPDASWLGRLVADDEAPATYRIQAGERLGQMGEDALPALPGLLHGAAAEDPIVRRQAARAIQQVGPKAVPAVRDALRDASDDPARQSLAAALWGLGDAGQAALKEFLRGTEAAEAEPLWWAACSGTWDGETVRQFQTAIREALQRAGQPVPTTEVSSRGRMPPVVPMPQQPNIAWSVNLLVDGQTPPMLRQTASGQLSRATPEKLVPLLPTLLNGFVGMDDPIRPYQQEIGSVVRRVGPPAVPVVSAAIEEAPTDAARRDLLQLLSTMGKQGHDEVDRLLQAHPEYGRLLGRNPIASEADPAP